MTEERIASIKWEAKHLAGCDMTCTAAIIEELLEENAAFRAQLAGQEREWRVAWEVKRISGDRWKFDGDDCKNFESAEHRKKWAEQFPDDYRNIRIESRTKAGEWEPTP